jgi:tRNA threonylcarbamoyladenosine biosynthesis protein TsaE
MGNKKALVFSLSGDLGCGKTVFSKSIGRELGINKKILSPTFVIYNQYSLKNSPFNIFYHFDLYRLNSENEFKEINFLKHFLPGTISCIEWPENMGANLYQQLKKKTNLITVNFTYLDNHTREISFSFPK